VTAYKRFIACAGGAFKSQDTRCGQSHNTVNPAAVLTAWVSSTERDQHSTPAHCAVSRLFPPVLRAGSCVPRVGLAVQRCASSSIYCLARVRSQDSSASSHRSTFSSELLVNVEQFHGLPCRAWTLSLICRISWNKRLDSSSAATLSPRSASRRPKRPTTCFACCSKSDRSSSSLANSRSRLSCIAENLSPLSHYLPEDSGQELPR